MAQNNTLLGLSSGIPLVIATARAFSGRTDGCGAFERVTVQLLEFDSLQQVLSLYVF